MDRLAFKTFSGIISKQGVRSTLAALSLAIIPSVACLAEDFGGTVRGYRIEADIDILIPQLPPATPPVESPVLPTIVTNAPLAPVLPPMSPTIPTVTPSVTPLMPVATPPVPPVIPTITPTVPPVIPVVTTPVPPVIPTVTPPLPPVTPPLPPVTPIVTPPVPPLAPPPVPPLPPQTPAILPPIPNPNPNINTAGPQTDAVVNGIIETSTGGPSPVDVVTATPSADPAGGDSPEEPWIVVIGDPQPAATPNGNASDPGGLGNNIMKATGINSEEVSKGLDEATKNNDQALGNLKNAFENPTNATSKSGTTPPTSIGGQTVPNGLTDALGVTPDALGKALDGVSKTTDQTVGNLKNTFGAQDPTK